MTDPAPGQIRDSGFVITRTSLSPYDWAPNVRQEETAPDDVRYIWYTDPGHGWLRVPLAELDRLGIRDKMSVYSYRSGGYAYLEEDCDALAFIDAKKARGEWPDGEIPETHTDSPSPVRGMDRL